MPQGFQHTAPLVHESGPMPWAPGPTDVERAERRRRMRVRACIEPGAIITDDEAEEILSTQAEGARMAMGDQAPSAPMPLVTPADRMQRSVEIWARIFIAICLIGALAWWWL